MSRYILPALLAGLLLLTACDSNDAIDDAPLEATLVEDIPADPTAGRDPDTGAPIQTGRYSLYSLRDNAVVLNYDNPDRSDSASTAWDIGLQGTNIIFNGGSSGPGQGGAVIVESAFEDVTSAPADSEFRVDGQSDCSTGAQLAVCPGSGNGWYNYDPATNIITPLPGRTIVVRTADGRFAKLRILSYYQGNPSIDEITQTTPSRYFTFEYVFQDDGSRDLSTN